MKYRRVNPRTWNDEKFLALDNPGKLLWLYLLTCPEATSVGLYHVNLGEVSKILKMNLESTRDWVKNYEDNGMAFFDEPSSLIWLPKWIDHNPPSGNKQLAGYLAATESYLPHDFAIALRMMLEPSLIEMKLHRSPFSDQQLIIIRDGVKCSFCEKEIQSFGDFAIARVDPTIEGDIVNNGVLSCKGCSDKKGDQSSEAFGYPFVSGGAFPGSEAFQELLMNEDLRRAFRALCHGLPEGFESIDEVSSMLSAIKSSKVTKKGKLSRGTSAAPDLLERILVFYNETKKTVYPTSRGVKAMPDTVRKKINARISEGATEDDLKAAILGNFQSVHHRDGKYHSMELIFRNADKLAMFIDKNSQPEISLDGKALDQRSDSRLGSFDGRSGKADI